MKDHIVLCGFGHVGYRIFTLLARLGERVVVIANQEPERWLPNPSTEFALVIGDGRDDRNLIKADIEGAKAIVAVTNDDMTNVSVALDAKRLNPRIRAVVRLFDPDLAPYLEKTMGIDRALCTPSLCVPLFVAAAVGGKMRSTLEVDGTSYHIEEVLVRGDSDGGDGTLGEWSLQGRKSVLAILRRGEVLVAPPDSLLLEAGDAITCVGPHHARVERRRRDHGRPRRRASGERLSSLVLGVKEWWREAPRGLQTVLMALSVVVLGSIGVFHFGLGMALLDSIYFVVTIVSTTGFGDFNLMNAPNTVKVYGIFLMLCGAAIVATLFSIVSDLVLSTRFRDVLAKGCKGYQGHFIVAGLGNIGLGVFRELIHNGEKAVAIEINGHTKFVETAKSLGPVVLGNARTEETLRKAGVVGARVIIAATDNDIANLSIGLGARRLNPEVQSVLRIFDANLADKMRHSLKHHVVLSTSSASSMTFVGAALIPEVLFGFEYHNYLVGVFRRRLQPPQERAPVAASDGADGETFLLYRTSQSRDFFTKDPSGDLSDVVEVIGAKWYRLKQESPI